MTRMTRKAHDKMIADRTRGFFRKDGSMHPEVAALEKEQEQEERIRLKAPEREASDWKRYE